MSLLAILAISATLATNSAPADCDGASTAEIEACFSRQLAAANVTLDRYVAAARKRLRDDAQSLPAGSAEIGARAAFDKAETAWAAYAKAECEAVYDDWADGTIRGTMDLTCRIDLTRHHTHEVWANWLTYMDSTPPILPEPPAN